MLLRIEDLSVSVATPLGPKSLLHGINLDVGEQRIVGLVGGSGSGKTTTSLAILRLLSSPVAVTGGRIIFAGQDLLLTAEELMRNIRGREIAMIFQEPLHALNPVFTIGDQVEELLRVHTSLSRRQRQEKIYELLRQMEIGDPLRVAQSYPHQLSGGLRQRAMIAQAIALNPRLLIADEPTSNLDVTVQARIIALFQKLRQDLKISIVLITHDLGLVRFLADDVAVMHEGSIIESGAPAKILVSPQQEYTRCLLKTIG